MKEVGIMLEKIKEKHQAALESWRESWAGPARIRIEKYEIFKFYGRLLELHGQ